MSDEPQVDPVLEQINATAPAKWAEPTRKGDHWACRQSGLHRWGFALEDYADDGKYKAKPIDREVCVRGRGSTRGRCPAEQPVNVPDDGPSASEPKLPVMRLPVSEILRLSRHDWGEPLVRGEDEAGVYWMRP